MSSQNEKSLIFNSENIRAILNDSKTQTRRVPIERYKNWKVGDRIWVRESFCICDNRNMDSAAPCYKASLDTSKSLACDGMRKWKPSIHLFRKYARIFLEITGLRDERVQDISWRDCKAEGVILIGDELVFNNQKQKHSLLKLKFSRLWESINAKRHKGIYAWDKNPKEKVIEFKRI